VVARLLLQRSSCTQKTQVAENDVKSYFSAYWIYWGERGMKNWVVIGGIGAMISSGQLTALPLGNPLDASWLKEGVLWAANRCDVCDPCLSWSDVWSLRIGYYGDIVFDRRLEVDEPPNDSDIRRSRLFTHAAYLAFNLCDRFDIFGTLGTTKFHIETPGSAFDLTVVAGSRYNDTVEVESETEFSWSLGVRATLWECGQFGLGAEAQYFYTRPRLNYLAVAPFNVSYFAHDARTHYREYQFGLGATYKIPIASCKTFVVPYVGAKWSFARLNMDDYLITLTSPFLETAVTASMHNLETHHHIGGIIGITLVGCEIWSLTAEGRFADELAFHINSQLRF
jgi:major outer membrane protein